MWSRGSDARMIERRAFITAVAMSVAVPARALAQQAPRVPHVGYLFSFTPSAGRQLWEACRQGLRDLGYAEGRNIILEPRWADGHHERPRARSGSRAAQGGRDRFGRHSRKPCGEERHELYPHRLRRRGGADEGRARRKSRAAWRQCDRRQSPHTGLERKTSSAAGGSPARRSDASPSSRIPTISVTSSSSKRRGARRRRWG